MAPACPAVALAALRSLSRCRTLPPTTVATEPAATAPTWKKTPLLRSAILADRVAPLLFGAAHCATLASPFAYDHTWRFLAFAAVCLVAWILCLWRRAPPPCVRPDPPPRRPLARLVAAEQAVWARHLR